MKRVIPEIEYASGFAWEGTEWLTFEATNKIIKFDGCYADSDYFKMFSYPLLKGNIATALNSPLSLCISIKWRKNFSAALMRLSGKRSV